MKKNIKLFLFLIMLFSLNQVVYADKIVAVECEYTDQYIAWLKLSDKEKRNVIMPPKCKTEGVFYTNSLARIFVGAGSADDSSFSLINEGCDTGPVYQAHAGTCWAFSALSGVESNLLVNNIKRNGTEAYRFSVAHLELSTQNSLFTTALPIDREYNVGGNHLISAAYFFNRLGPVLEEEVPYSIITNNVYNGTPITEDDLGDSKAIVSVNDYVEYNNGVGPCTTKAINSIKEYLVTNGGIGALLYFDANYFSSDYMYYYDNNIDSNIFANHGVTIIGWNDNVSPSMFDIAPPGAGAWYVKNSNHRQAGYHYVSYYDTHICSYLGGFYNVSEDIDDNVYVYDELGPNVKAKYTNNIYFANKFSRKGSSNKEKLKKVTINGETVGQRYDILYSSTGLLNDSQEIVSGATIEKVGYTTVDVSNQNINITNDTFAIIVKYYNNVGDFYVGAFVEDDDEELWYSNLDVVPGRSFMSSNGTTWSDFKTSGGDVVYLYTSIKAYTDDVVENVNTFNANFYTSDGVASIGKTTDSCTTSGTSCTITLPTITASNGYRVLGWYENVSDTTAVGQPGSTYTLTGNTKLYARAEWQVTTYSASLVVDEGINELQNDILTCSTSAGNSKCNITLPTISLKNGYEFLGWYNAQTGGTRMDTNGNTVELSANVTLYARSRQSDIEYIVNFSKDSGTSAIGRSSSVCTVEDGHSTCTIKLPTITAKSGYQVLGWYTSASGGNKVGDANSDYTVSSNTTLYARTEFIPRTFTVQFNTTTGVSVVGISSSSCTTQNGNSTCTIKLPTITASSNYTVLGWYTENGTAPVGQPNDNYTVSSDIVLYAKASLEITGYMASFVATDGVMSVQYSSSSCTLSSGSTCKITLPTITASTGYNVLGWYDSATGGTKIGNAGSEYTLTRNITLYARATFAASTFTVSFSKTTGVSAVGKSSSSCTLSSGNSTCTVKLPTITAATGYTVLGWYDSATGGNKVGDANSNYTVSNNTTLYARVKENTTASNKFVVSFSSGSSNVTVGSGSITCSTSTSSCKITLPTITAAPGYIVLGWYDSETGGNKLGNPGDEYIVTGDVTLYARIMADPDNDPSVNNDTELIIDNNPNNEIIENNVNSNPKTGGARIFILVLLTLSLVFVFYYTRYRSSLYGL